jgi:hypothetical protein
MLMEKIAAKFINHRMNNLLSVKQYDFKEGSGTDLAKLHIHYMAQKSGKRKAVLIDVKKPYDSVKKNILKEKINKKMHLGDAAFMYSLLDIQGCIEIQVLGADIKATKGLLQASPLSPTFFNIYIYGAIRFERDLSFQKIITKFF